MIPHWDALWLLMIKPTTKSSISGKHLCFVWKKNILYVFLLHTHIIYFQTNKTQTRTHTHTHTHIYIYIYWRGTQRGNIYMSDMGEITIIIYWRWSSLSTNIPKSEQTSKQTKQAERERQTLYISFVYLFALSSPNIQGILVVRWC